MIGDVHYLNSGDWVESLSALVEHHDGRFEVIRYDEFCQRLEEKTANGEKKRLRRALYLRMKNPSLSGKIPCPKRN